MKSEVDAYQDIFLKLAIQTAEKARGNCSPNPFVGAVVVKQNRVISTGWTQPYGFDHAEVQALKKAGAKARDADLYVSLEPCSHFGKTPPCALAIIKAKIKRVFIGIIDPNPLVAGKGIKMLHEAGIEVHWGFHNELIERQLEYYLCYIRKQRPFVTLKTALTLDGKYAANDGSSRWITGEKARKYVHKLRSQHEVVLTGVSTILTDDPLLNVRLPGKPKQPLRAVLDPELQTPIEAKLAQSASEYATLIFCGEKKLDTDKAATLKAKGVQLCGLPVQDGLFNIQQVLAEIAGRKLYSVLLETGSGVAESFIKAGLVDKYLIFFGTLLLGGANSPYPNLGFANISQALALHQLRIKRWADDIMISAYPLP